VEVDNRRALGSRYELVARLGSGAMGEVWQARDRVAEVDVAAKLLRSELTRDPEIVTRFVRERSILLGLNHPGIVRVRDLVVEGEDLAIVMDLVQGGDLRQRLREAGTLPPRLAVGVTCAILDGLAVAHASGCLHRDVKPDNVLIAGPGDFGPRDVRLSDFSIARLAQESTVMATGLLGTPAYMPPELFVRGSFSAASDVYAAGILLYELLAGRTPFAGPGTAHTVGNRHASAEPPRLPVPDALWQPLAVMLAKDPAARLTAADTAEVLRNLDPEVLAGPALPVQPEPESWETVTAPPATPLHVRETPAGVDVGETFVRSGDLDGPPVATPGAVRAIAPVTGVDLDLTQVGREAPETSRPVLVPQLDAPAEKRRRRWLVALVVLVCVAGLGLGAWGLTSVLGDDSGGNGGGPAAPPQAGPSQATTLDDARPTGLTVSRTATYDPEEGVVDLTVRYAAQAAPLRGPFLEVLPPAAAGEQCPLAAWEGSVGTANLPQVSGIAVPCGFSVDPGQEVPAQGSLEVRAQVPVTLDADPEALQAWLTSVSESTASAAASQPAGASYPAQRLEDVVVEVPSEVRLGTPSVRVRLLPVWSGADGPDRLQVLYDSTAVGKPAAVLAQVAGGLDGVRLGDGCGGAIVITEGPRVGVLRAADACTVTARVGNFTDLESDTFRIARAGG
jgi:serine/threonine-protein kinase